MLFQFYLPIVLEALSTGLAYWCDIYNADREVTFFKLLSEGTTETHFGLNTLSLF